MKSFARAFLAISLVAAAHAASAGPNTEPTITRAEVLADLQLHRESGLYFLDAAEMSPLSPKYKSARNRYDELRSSPRYAQLVQKYASHGAERTTPGPASHRAEG